VSAGMVLVEEERKRGEEQCAVLVKRIQFLSEELEEARTLLEQERESYAELLEAAKELADERKHADEKPNRKCDTNCSGGQSFDAGRVCSLGWLWGFGEK